MLKVQTWVQKCDAFPVDPGTNLVCHALFRAARVQLVDNKFIWNVVCGRAQMLENLDNDSKRQKYRGGHIATYEWYMNWVPILYRDHGPWLHKSFRQDFGQKSSAKESRSVEQRVASHEFGEVTPERSRRHSWQG